MIFSITNPHDAYTFEAIDKRVAVVACLLLGSGRYGLRLESEEEGEWAMPILFLNMDDQIHAWSVEQFGVGINAVIAEVSKDAKDAVADCLDSIVLGSPQERASYFLCLAQVKGYPDDEEAIGKFWQSWQCRASSLTNLGQTAKAIAAKIRGLA